MRTWFGRRKSKGGEGDEGGDTNDESGKRDSLDPKYPKEMSLGIFRRTSSSLNTSPHASSWEGEQDPKDKELTAKAEEVTLLSMTLDREIKRMLYIVKEENSNQSSWMCKTVPLLVLLMGHGKDGEYSGEREKVETVVCSSNPWP